MRFSFEATTAFASESYKSVLSRYPNVSASFIVGNNFATRASRGEKDDAATKSRLIVFQVDGRGSADSRTEIQPLCDSSKVV